MKSIILFLLLWGSCAILSAQESNILILHKTSCDSIQYALTPNGKKAFELAPNDQFVIENTLDASRGLIGVYVYLYDVSRGPIVARNSDRTKYYLLDPDGKIIKTLTEFGTIFSAWGGFLKVQYPKTERGDPYIYSFLDKYGNLAFEGQQFLYATSFNEGKAIVKTMEKEWAVINDKGKLVGKLPANLQSSIWTAKTFINGFALIKIRSSSGIRGDRDTYGYYYIDEFGKEGFSVTERLGDFNFSPIPFYGEYAWIKKADEFIFFNKEGKEVNRINGILSAKSSNEDYVLFYKTDYTYMLFSKKTLEEVVLGFDAEEQIIMDRLMGKHLKYYYKNKTTGKAGYRYLNLETGENDFVTNHRVLEIVDDKILSGSKEYPNDLYFIQNAKGEYLFKGKCK